jgi:hypothetical protein
MVGLPHAQNKPIMDNFLPLSLPHNPNTCTTSKALLFPGSFLHPSLAVASDHPSICGVESRDPKAEGDDDVEDESDNDKNRRLLLDLWDGD